MNSEFAYRCVGAGAILQNPHHSRGETEKKHEVWITSSHPTSGRLLIINMWSFSKTNMHLVFVFSTHVT
jgi:hypothetical protein